MGRMQRSIRLYHSYRKMPLDHAQCHWNMCWSEFRSAEGPVAPPPLPRQHLQAAWLAVYNAMGLAQAPREYWEHSRFWAGFAVCFLFGTARTVFGAPLRTT